MFINALFDSITPESTIVVANNRQALTIKNHYHQHQQKHQRKTWQIPTIYTWRNFLIHLHQIIADVPPLVSEQMQQQIWRDMIAKNSQNTHYPTTNNPPINDPTIWALTDKALRDYGSVSGYQIPVNRNTLTEPFHRWLEQYHHFLQQKNWLSFEQLVPLVLSHTNLINTPLFFYGFTDYTPEQQQFLKAVPHQLLNTIAVSTTLSTAVFDSLDEEIHHCAEQVKQHLGSTRSIAIVVPNLGEVRQRLTAIFDDVLSADIQRPLQVHEKPYNLSLGKALNEYDLIKDALHIIEFSALYAQQSMTSLLFKETINSVFISGFSAEQLQRSQLLNHRYLQQPQLSHHELDEMLAACPIFKTILNSLPSKTQWTGEKTYAEWHHFFNQILALWGVGIETKHSSTLHQLIDKLKDTLRVFNEISSITPPTEFNQALQTFKRLSNRTIFQPQSGKTNIHILGLLEAHGLYFDEVYVIGCHHKALPGNIQPPHFIHYSAARKYHLPGAEHSDNYHYALNMLNHLKQCASYCHLSYAKTDGNQYFQGCALIDFSTAAKHSITDKPTKPVKPFTALGDSIAPTVTNQVIKQGVEVLKNQGLCPFKGFAHRLYITFNEPSSIGFSALEKGNILHKTLELIFQTIHSHNELTAISNPLIERCIERALKPYHKNKHIHTLERNRLLAIVTQFLTKEAERSPFTIIATEHNKTVTINGLTFDVRLDRIDEIAQKRIIFDYKTGSTPSLTTLPLQATQLPIYAITNRADGVAFIRLKSDEVAYKGLGVMLEDSNGNNTNNTNSTPIVPFTKIVKKEQITWDEQKTIWQSELNRVSHNFQQGDAAVLPTKDACKYCQLDSLCRINRW